MSLLLHERGIHTNGRATPDAQGTDLVAVVPERAADHLRRTMDPAHAWLRARIAEIAAELDQATPAAQP